MTISTRHDLRNKEFAEDREHRWPKGIKFTNSREAILEHDYTRVVAHPAIHPRSSYSGSAALRCMEAPGHTTIKEPT